MGLWFGVVGAKVSTYVFGYNYVNVRFISNSMRCHIIYYFFTKVEIKNSC